MMQPDHRGDYTPPPAHEVPPPGAAYLARGVLLALALAGALVALYSCAAPLT